MTASAELSDQLLTSDGLQFGSEGGSPFVAVIDQGLGHAADGVNGIGAVAADGSLSYAIPIVIEFFLPSDPALAAVTDFISIQGDLWAGSGQTVTLEAFDANGGLIGSTSQIEGPDLLTLSFSGAGIHSIRLTQSDPTLGGVGFDNLTFNNLAAAPEPSTLMMAGMGALALAGRFRSRSSRAARVERIYRSFE